MLAALPVPVVLPEPARADLEPGALEPVQPVVVPGRGAARRRVLGHAEVVAEPGHAAEQPAVDASPGLRIQLLETPEVFLAHRQARNAGRRHGPGGQLRVSRQVGPRARERLADLHEARRRVEARLPRLVLDPDRTVEAVLVLLAQHVLGRGLPRLGRRVDPAACGGIECEQGVLGVREVRVTLGGAEGIAGITPAPLALDLVVDDEADELLDPLADGARVLALGRLGRDEVSVAILLELRLLRVARVVERVQRLDQRGRRVDRELARALEVQAVLAAGVVEAAEVEAALDGLVLRRGSAVGQGEDDERVEPDLHRVVGVRREVLAEAGKAAVFLLLGPQPGDAALDGLVHPRVECGLRLLELGARRVALGLARGTVCRLVGRCVAACKDAPCQHGVRHPTDHELHGGLLGRCPATA